jgi:hypothetical protein
LLSMQPSPPPSSVFSACPNISHMLGAYKNVCVKQGEK